VKFVARKNGMTTNCFSSLSFVADFGSGIRDLGSGTRNPGSGTRDPGWVKSGSGIRDKHPGSATLLFNTGYEQYILKISLFYGGAEKDTYVKRGTMLFNVHLYTYTSLVT
jgi:hypothetical protein